MPVSPGPLRRFLDRGRARRDGKRDGLLGIDVLGPVVGSAVFLVINLLVYTGATMLSYLAHAPRAAKNGTTAEQRLREATGRVRRSGQHLEHTDIALDEALHANRARAAQILAYHRGLMTVYCAANLRARGGPEMPPVLRDFPAITVPPVLREPDEHSPNGRVTLREGSRA